MSYYVYALKSKQRNYIYVGMTNDVARRLLEHNKGYNRTTKPYRPFTLIYSKELPSRPEARLHEKYMKSTQGKRYLRRKIKEDLD
ncbi:MAG TPA: GIY-YIG nuclease family protein [Saprospiraceae bacterium]|nr:GIY-YIG nuclease family protein [Saprospiraceae bacterium]